MKRKIVKYAEGGLLGPDDPKPKKKAGYDFMPEIKSAFSKKMNLSFDNKPVNEVVMAAAKRGNIDPSFLVSSAWQEGFNKAVYKPDEVSEAYDNAYKKDKELANFPVDGFYNYGLDTFGNRYNELKKYLPEGFENQFHLYDAFNEKQEKIKTVAFKNNEDALVAKAAFLNYEKDRVSNYAKSKGVTPDQKLSDYLTLAAYNGGYGNAQKIVDQYASSKDQANFIDKGLTQQGGVHKNIYPRLQRQEEIKQILGYEKGGKIRPKYEDGTEDPITGRTGPTLNNPQNVGVNVWNNAKTSQLPLNPDAPRDQQIFALNQQGTPNQQAPIVPLSQFYDTYQDNYGNTQFRETGRYVNDQGEINTLDNQKRLANEVSQSNYDKAQGREKTMDEIEKYGAIGISAINSYLGSQANGKQNRRNRRSAIMQDILSGNTNPYLNGTGSQAIFENGGEISTGQAMFQVLDGGKTKQLSNNVHSNPMIEFVGKEHSEGGIGIQYGGKVAEVENKEVGWVDDQGGLNIFGKLKVPGTNKTFKKVAKDLAKEEDKVDKNLSRYTMILNQGDESDPYQKLSQSTAKVMFKSLDKQSKEIAEKKEGLADYQNLILSMVQPKNVDKKEKGGRMQYAEGGEIDLDAALRAIAGHEGGKPGMRTNLKGSDGKRASASGTFQMINSTVKGVWNEHFKSQYPNFADFRKKFDSDGEFEYQVAKAHLSDLVKQYGDYALGAWYSPSHAQRALNGDKNALKEIPGKSWGNKQTFGQYMDDINKRYAKASGTSTQGGEDPFSYRGIAFNPKDARVLYNMATSDPDHPLNKDAKELQRLRTYLGMKDNTPVVSSNGEQINTNTLNYTPKFEPVGNQRPQTPPMETPYGYAQKQPTPFFDKVSPVGEKKRDFLSPLAIEQIAPELLTMATNRRQPVEQQTYQPDLQQTFDISYQLGRNENQSTFNQAAKIAEQTGNMEALSQLAAQKYQADERYNMQEIQGNAQQRLGVYNQNTATQNDAKLKNLALISDQSAKQAQATFNTRAENMAAFASISGKILQNNLENRTYNAYANLFKHYGFDSKGNVTFNPDEVTQRFSSTEAQQFGLMAAQQGVNAIMSGDYNRQFKRVKNDDGSTTTTETLGKNKQIQEKAKALKAQGFEDVIIGNILRAEFPETISGE